MFGQPGNGYETRRIQTFDFCHRSIRSFGIAKDLSTSGVGGTDSKLMFRLPKDNLGTMPCQCCGDKT
jgi:hypothetical protein